MHKFQFVGKYMNKQTNWHASTVQNVHRSGPLPFSGATAPRNTLVPSRNTSKLCCSTAPLCRRHSSQSVGPVTQLAQSMARISRTFICRLAMRRRLSASAMLYSP